MTIQTHSTQSSSTALSNTAVTESVLRVLEGNRAIAAETLHREPQFEDTIREELNDRFGWTVDAATVRDAVEDLGPAVVRRCARPTPY